MSLKKWNGAWADLTTMKRWNGTSWVDLTIAKKWDGAAWVDLGLSSGNLSATVSASSVSGLGGDGEGPAFQLITSSPVLVTSTGGAGAGPTYAWTLLSGSSKISADSPTSAITTFSALLGLQKTAQSVMRCTVTRGVDTVTVDVNVTLENIAERGPGGEL